VQRLASVPAGAGRDNALRALTSAWARNDFSAALEWAQQLNASDRAVAIESALAELIPSDPLRALQIARQSLTGAALDRALGTAIRQLASTDPAGAAAIVSSLPPGPARTAAAVDAAHALATKNPVEALTWAKSFPAADPLQWLVTRRVLEVWATREPLAAGNYVLSLPPDRTRHDAALAVADTMAARDPQNAIAWVQSLPSVETRQVALANIADRWARRDAAAAARWIVGQPVEALGELTTKSLDGALSYWVLQDSTAAQEFIRTLPAPVQARAANFTAPLFAQSDPAAAMTWAQSLPDPTARDIAVTRAFARWLDNAPSAARAWLSGSNLPPETKTRLGTGK
jgi:hypothetical protein